MFKLINTSKQTILDIICSVLMQKSGSIGERTERQGSYHGQLPSNIPDGDSAREEYTWQPGADVKKVWGGVPWKE